MSYEDQEIDPYLEWLAAGQEHFARAHDGWPDQASLGWISLAYGDFAARAWQELSEVVGPCADGEAEAMKMAAASEGLAEWADAREVRHSDRFLSVRMAAKAGEVAERTVRRWIADGVLPTLEVFGPRGMEHRIFIPTLYRVLQQKSGALARPTSPMDGMQEMILAMQEQVKVKTERLEAEAERMESAGRALIAKLEADALAAESLRDIIQKQQETIQRMANEMHDMRGQMGMLHDQVLKALPEPKRVPWWKRLIGQKRP